MPRAPNFRVDVSLAEEQVFLSAQIEVVEEYVPFLFLEFLFWRLVPNCVQFRIHSVVAPIEFSEQALEQLEFFGFLLLHGHHESCWNSDGASRSRPKATQR